MILTEATQLISKARAVAQHEFGHYVTAIALGFEGQGVSIQVQSQAHSGKSRSDNVVRCETLEELQSFVRRRVIILLAGAMAETIDRSSYQVDGRAAYDILTGDEAGSERDYSTASELVQLLHNSMPLVIDTQTGKEKGSLSLMMELWAEASTMVNLNARAICGLADVLEARVVQGRGVGGLQKNEIEQIDAYRQIQRVSL